MTGTDPTDLTTLLQRLDVLESAAAIRALKADYLRRCDASPRPSFRDLLWPDAVWQGYQAATAGPIQGADAIDAMLSGPGNRFTFAVHYLTNEHVAVAGERAIGHWNLLEPCTVAGVGSIWQGGHYVDTFERRGGEWRFARMELHLQFRTPYPEPWRTIAL